MEQKITEANATETSTNNGKYRLVVNRGGDITRDIEFKTRAAAKQLFEQITTDFCQTHGMKHDTIQEDVFVSKKYGFSVSLTRAAA